MVLVVYIDVVSMIETAMAVLTAVVVGMVEAMVMAMDQVKKVCPLVTHNKKTTIWKWNKKMRDSWKWTSK